jgi:hypothetical protein
LVLVDDEVVLATGTDILLELELLCAAPNLIRHKRFGELYWLEMADYKILNLLEN